MDEKIKKLRGIGTTLNAKFNIGKNGITDNVVSNIKNELKKESLVKIRILKNYIACLFLYPSRGNLHLTTRMHRSPHQQAQ